MVRAAVRMMVRSECRPAQRLLRRWLVAMGQAVLLAVVLLVRLGLLLVVPMLVHARKVAAMAKQQRLRRGRWHAVGRCGFSDCFF